MLQYDDHHFVEDLYSTLTKDNRIVSWMTSKRISVTDSNKRDKAVYD